MKKISFFALLIMALCAAMTSCKDDTQPRLHAAPGNTFTLNNPPMAGNTYYLTPGGSVEFTVSQPDYGVATTPRYTIQISKSDTFVDEVIEGEEVITPANYQTIKGSWTKATIDVPAKDFAIALNKLNGIKDEDDEPLFKAEPYTLYVRCIADIPYCEYAHAESNIIKLDAVIPYFVVSVPGVFYITGECNGWPTPDETYITSEGYNESWLINETEAESGIFKGAIEMTPQQAAAGFRFYNALTGWGDNGVPPSLGPTPDDFSSKDCPVKANNVYSGNCVWGKGNFLVSNWPGGMMAITINTNEMTIEFELQK